ncbi:MAG: D-alanine--D-alanine ligase, partial [Lachnospiraceae bacterium]|nr:D-alanine--D-alanine ligase [Lachnospiraceae bacterium]
MKIVVLAGGLCPERDVSLLSGTKVCNALRQNGHQAVMVDIYMGLPGYQQKDLEALFEMDGSLLPDPRISSTMPDLNGLKEKRTQVLDSADSLDGGLYSHASQLGPNVLELCRLADICFMGLHGGIGENGMLQATLDVLGIKYTGASSLASALAMHKGVTKQILSDAGVPNARGRQIHEDDRYTPLSELGFELPCVVKV